MVLDRGFPDASLFTAPMFVASPQSCMASDVGAPALAESIPLSFAKERHSGPESSDTSDITNPHLPQNLSPVVLSVRMKFFPQRLQISLVDDNLTQLICQM